MHLSKYTTTLLLHQYTTVSYGMIQTWYLTGSVNVVISIYFIHMELNSKEFFGAQNGAIGHNIMTAQRLVTIFISG